MPLTHVWSSACIRACLMDPANAKADEVSRGLPGPKDEHDAARMERKARDAERRIDDLHRESDPEDAPIYEE